MSDISIGDLCCNLSSTASLLKILDEKYFIYPAESVRTDETFGALSKNEFNNGKTAPSHEVIRTYKLVSDCISIILERINEAVRMCEELEDAEL